MSTELSEVRVNKTDEFLAHYASEYYDPVKAREYYLRTRELKGRNPAKLTTPQQKDRWAVAKDQINQHKKYESNTLKWFTKAHMTQLREKAEKTRAEITEKLEKAFADASSDRERRIAALPKIPENASPQTRQRIQAARNKELAKIEESTRNTKTSATTEAGENREAVANELRDAIDSTRELYKTKVEEMVAKYEAVTQQEYDRISKS